MPEGIRCSFHSTSPRTIVCPALLPPWKRTTAPARSASRSVIFPFPSSPHWAPTMTIPGIATEVYEGLPRMVLPAPRPTPLHRLLRIALAGVVHELRVLLLEGQRDFADRPVAVLGDDQIGLSGTLGVLVVVLVAVDEHHQVGVLLEVPRLAQVRELRFLVRARLHRAAELRERDHRHAELAREDLQAAAELADGGHAAVVAAVGAHQLQVVDDDQPKPALALAVQPPRLCADLQHPHVAGVVHPQRRVRESLARAQDLRPALLGHPPLAQLLALDPRL